MHEQEAVPWITSTDHHYPGNIGPGLVREHARDIEILSFNHSTILLGVQPTPVLQMGRQRSRPQHLIYTGVRAGSQVCLPGAWCLQPP
jgi:hypothetical protein